MSALPFQASDRPAPWSPSRVTVLGDAIHGMPPAGGNGANTALRDAALLTRQLVRAARGEQPLIEAVGEYETEMRDYGFAAVDEAMKTLRRGLASNPVQTFFTQGWMSVCQAVSPLRRISFAGSCAGISAPRRWER